MKSPVIMQFASKIGPFDVCLIHHFARLGLAVVFVLAGMAKLSDIPEFATQVGAFGLVYDEWVLPAAWIIALGELVAGLALAINLRGSPYFLIMLLGLFVAVLAYGISLGLDISCGCFGPGYHVSLRTQLFIDMGLLVWSGFVLWSGKRCRTRTLGARAALCSFAGQQAPPP